uniref:Putative reverse transcriptase domain-containing protein n=1 Tax=Tanacetum cinerariifolium TaxID=118510 RepID=A0A699HQ86_TANCI|nr:putative reverse transcriptase domain-containing protein [Tanacetum cinerariifolium]
MSNKGSLITKKPVEGPPIELLKWYGYDTDLYQEGEFSGTDNDTTDNASSDEDTIQKSQSPNSKAPLSTFLRVPGTVVPLGSCRSQKFSKKQLSSVHSTFYVSKLKKCMAEEPLAIPLEEIQVDVKLNFIEEPIEIMDREVKRLKQSRILIVRVRWNSWRGHEFT